MPKTPNLTNSPKSPYRNAHSIEKKLSVIALYHDIYHENASETARETMIDRTLISRWVNK